VEHWLTDEYVDSVLTKYAADASHLVYDDFLHLARDGLLLNGHVEEYQRAFKALDRTGKGWLERHEIASVFDSLEVPLDTSALDAGHADRDVKISMTDFLQIVRGHLDLQQVLDYVTVKPELQSAVHAPFGQITRIRSEEDLEMLVATGDTILVQLAFTWCKPCKKFAAAYERLSATYSTVRFLKIYGNDNESTKHYGKEVIKAKTSPMFLLYKQGKMVESWSGINENAFVQNLAKHL